MPLWHCGSWGSVGAYRDRVWALRESGSKVRCPTAGSTGTRGTRSVTPVTRVVGKAMVACSPDVTDGVSLARARHAAADDDDVADAAAADVDARRMRVGSVRSEARALVSSRAAACGVAWRVMATWVEGAGARSSAR